MTATKTKIKLGLIVVFIFLIYIGMIAPFLRRVTFILSIMIFVYKAGKRE